MTLSLVVAAAPTAAAQSSLPELPALPQLAQIPALPPMPQLSSDVSFKNPFEPTVAAPSTQAGYGLRGAIEVYLAGQGYSIDRGGAAEAQALEFAQQGFNGEIWLNSNGVSNPIYLPHGEGIVSRVKSEHLHATSHWYMTATPREVHNPKRAGVETWSVPGGDVYVGQFFTYN